MTLLARQMRLVAAVSFGLLVLASTVPGPARANYVLMTGETWNDAQLHGVLLLPSGSIFSFEAEALSLVSTHVANNETVVFDVDAAMATVEIDPPSVLLITDPFFMTFADHSEVQAWNEGALDFEGGPSGALVDTLGVVTWVGEVNAPAPAGGGSSGGGSGPTDTDGDGIPNITDNCDTTPNPSQANNDGDSLGDACDPDDDNDGVADIGDNCPTTSNAQQTDTDSDGLGNACDPDDDGDGLSDVLEIGTYGTDPLKRDTDGDGVDDDVEIAAGTDPLDDTSFPSTSVPALGVVGLVLLSAALMAVGVVFRSRRREDARPI